jgi:hypothetical protein
LRRCWTQSAPPTKKTFFIIRHGESKWNDAQANWNVGGMAHYDHALSKSGIEQCLALNKAWQRAKVKYDAGVRGHELAKLDDNDSASKGSHSESKDEFKSGDEKKQSEHHNRSFGEFNGGNDNEVYFIEKFLNADFCFASPLTRAVQTALLVMRDHPCVKNHGLTYLSNIRERKNAGGLDTVGSCCGDEIIKRCQTQLAEDGYESLWKSLECKIDIGDTATRWWTLPTAADSDEYLDQRIEEMLNRAHFCNHLNPVFVGHSLFFHRFYQRAMSAEFVKAYPELAAKMKAHKLHNATMMGVEVEYSPNDKPKIIRASVMFGGHFH